HDADDQRQLGAKLTWQEPARSPDPPQRIDGRPDRERSKQAQHQAQKGEYNGPVCPRAGQARPGNRSASIEPAKEAATLSAQTRARVPPREAARPWPRATIAPPSP